MENPSDARGDGATLIGVGAALMLIVLLVLQSFSSTGLFAVKTETSTVTASLDQQEVSAVSESFSEHLQEFESLNASAFADQYAHNATIIWTGDINSCCAPQTVEMTPGGVEVPLAHGLALGLEGKIDLSGITENVSALADNSATVNATFVLEGTSSYLGNVNGTINAREDYVYSPPLDGSTFGGWLIARESWDFRNMTFQFPLPFTG